MGTKSKKSNKRILGMGKADAIQWAALIAVVLVLWITGWHAPVVAGIQRAVLATGIMQPKLEPEVIDGREAPNMRLLDEHGQAVDLRSFSGKPVFLNFWATWCPPCRAEMPGIHNLYGDLDGEEVHFVMISTDRDFEMAVQYKARHGFTFPIYALNGNIPPELYGSTIPRTYVLDTSGRVVMEHVGMAKYDTKKFRKFLLDPRAEQQPS